MSFLFNITGPGSRKENEETEMLRDVWILQRCLFALSSDAHERMLLSTSSGFRVVLKRKSRTNIVDYEIKHTLLALCVSAEFSFFCWLVLSCKSPNSENTNTDLGESSGSSFTFWGMPPLISECNRCRDWSIVQFSNDLGIRPTNQKNARFVGKNKCIHKLEHCNYPPEMLVLLNIMWVRSLQSPRVLGNSPLSS